MERQPCSCLLAVALLRAGAISAEQLPQSHQFVYLHGLLESGQRDGGQWSGFHPLLDSLIGVPAEQDLAGSRHLLQPLGQIDARPDGNVVQLLGCADIANDGLSDVGDGDNAFMRFRFPAARTPPAAIPPPGALPPEPTADHSADR